MRRYEHDFYHMMVDVVYKLPDSPEKEELIAIIDGYFLVASKRTRESDFDIDEEIKRNLLRGEQ